MNVSFYTLGCKVNQFETDAMMQMFENRGYKIIDPCEDTDVFIVNSCTVTAASDKKTRNLVKRSRKLNGEGVVVLAGCYAQGRQDELKEEDNIDIVVGTKHKDSIVDFVVEYFESKHHLYRVDEFKPREKYEEMTISHTSERTRATIKIQDGCRQFCTYCIIPYVRGPVRSREIKDITDEILRLHSNGYKEIVFNGIHMTSYGTDLEDTKLEDLVDAINKLKLEDIRFRFGSLEPGIISSKFMEKLVEGSFCDHFHLSLQSGSDTVLERMNRRYDTYEYREKVKLIKSYMPQVGITTDIIVGFPGETQEEFEETCRYVEDIRFSKVHIFPFSPRKGTKAFDMDNKVLNQVKKHRARTLGEICEKTAEVFYSDFIGKKLDVLYESLNDSGEYIGHSSNYLTVLTKSSSDLHNSRKNVRMSYSDNSFLYTEEV
jgi:threonylcarbamoyladenosine tRNA methylthiotransferase MtaB